MKVVLSMKKLNAFMSKPVVWLVIGFLNLLFAVYLCSFCGAFDEPSDLVSVLFGVASFIAFGLITDFIEWFFIVRKSSAPADDDK